MWKREAPCREKYQKPFSVLLSRVENLNIISILHKYRGTASHRLGCFLLRDAFLSLPRTERLSSLGVQGDGLHILLVRIHHADRLAERVARDVLGLLALAERLGRRRHHVARRLPCSPHNKVDRRTALRELNARDLRPRVLERDTIDGKVDFRDNRGDADDVSESHQRNTRNCFTVEEV